MARAWDPRDPNYVGPDDEHEPEDGVVDEREPREPDHDAEWEADRAADRYEAWLDSIGP